MDHNEITKTTDLIHEQTKAIDTVRQEVIKSW